MENNCSLKEAEQDIKRIGGSLLGTSAAVGDLATPILNPRETLNALILLKDSPDRVELLKLGFILLIEERQQEYDLFVQQNDVFGQSMVIGRSTGDIGLAIGGAAQLIAKSPATLKYFSTALAQLKRTGSATINGVKIVYVAGKISRAADNVPSSGLNSQLNFATTPGNHMNNPARYVPVHILQEAIKTGIPVPDPRESKAIMYYIKITRNGKPYNLEVLYDNSTNKILHFEYFRNARGPLPAIKSQ